MHDRPLLRLSEGEWYAVWDIDQADLELQIKVSPLRICIAVVDPDTGDIRLHVDLEL